MKMRKNIRMELRSFKIKGLNLKSTVQEGTSYINNLSSPKMPGCYPYCSGQNLSGLDLRGLDLTDAYLTNADLTKADLRGADLRYADLTNAIVQDAKLKGAIGATLNGTRGTPDYNT